MIGKLVNGNLTLCPKQGMDNLRKYHTDLRLYYTHNPDIAIQDEYYPVLYTEMPGENYECSWQLINEQIIQIWAPYNENEN